MASVKVNFYLNTKPDKKGTHVIFLYCSFAGKRVSISTRESVSPKMWYKKEKEINSRYTDAAKANERLRKIKTEVEKIFQPENTSSLPIIEQIREKIELINPVLTQGMKVNLDPEPTIEPVKDIPDVKSEITPLLALEEWVQDRIENESFSSAKGIKVFKKHLNNFIDLTYTHLSFDGIDDNFYEGFRKYLRNTLKHSINTEAKHVKLLARFLKFCAKKKYVTILDYKEFESVKETLPAIIKLDHNELKLLEDAVMPTQSLERIKDVFLFQLYCGMRYADVENLKKEDIDGFYIRFFILKKTKGRIEHEVALTAEAKAILEKYNDLPGDKALPVLSNQKTNAGLKEVGRIAGLIRKVKKKMVYGNKEVITSTPKYKLLSSHMARKSFISLCISANMIESKIKAQTGHDKNSKAFGRYYDVSSEDKKDMVDVVFKK